MSSQPANPSTAAADAPSTATDAVLKPSDPVPDGARQVKGIEFDDYARSGRSITVQELVAGMETMGFQATSVGQAVRVIDSMVRSSQQRFFFSLDIT